MPTLDPADNGAKPKKTAAKKAAAPKATPKAAASGQAQAAPQSGYLNFAQLEALALKAGASTDEAVQLAAIAMAESSGDIGSHNTNAGTGDNSYGLWQINMLGAMGPERRQAFGIGNNNALFDPLTNAKAALHMLRTQGWQAWSTYTSGAYQQFLPDAQAAITHAPNVNVSKLHYSPTSYGGGGGGAFGTPKQLTVQQYLDDPAIAQDYGYLTAFLKNPAIGPVLAKAAQQGWGANQLLGAFNNKKEFPAAYAWWHETAATARAWQAQKRLDPATAQQRLGAMERQVQTLAQSTLGYKLDGQRLTQLANHAIALNWSQQDLQHAVGAEFHYNAAQQKYLGAAGQTLNQLKQMSQDYLVPLSDHTLNQWTRGVLEGVYQPQDFTNYMKTQAESLYPTLKAALDSGKTVRQYLDPYAQLAAQTLEVSPDSINWFDPKWSKALNTTTPDGQRAPMSLSDWTTYLRGLPDYQATQGATDQAYSFGQKILQTFGKVG